MPALKTLVQILLELRSPHAIRAQSRVPDAGPLLSRLIAGCKTVNIEERDGGRAFRLAGVAENTGSFSVTCVLHRPGVAPELTTAERAVAQELCEGRTLAQIARLRGVSKNTVKSQVKQVFRKLDVGSRVALVRKLCP